MPALPEIAREHLLTAIVGRAEIERVEVVRIELAPGQRAGLHLHPCPVVGCVLSGTIRFQIDGDAARTLETGDAFFEPANQSIVAFDNGSPDEPAAFLACYLLPSGEDRLIVMLA